MKTEELRLIGYTDREAANKALAHVNDAEAPELLDAWSAPLNDGMSIELYARVNQPVSAAVAGVPAVVEPTFTERGFARWLITETTYGADVEVYESSAASGPHIWLRVNQPAPSHPGMPEKADACAHMTLDQARDVHAKLSAAIAFMSDRFEEAPSATPSPLPQAEMPRDATEGVTVNRKAYETVCCALGHIRVGVDDPKEFAAAALRQAAAIESGAQHIPMVDSSAGSTAASAGEQDKWVTVPRRATDAMLSVVQGSLRREGSAVGGECVREWWDMMVTAAPRARPAAPVSEPQVRAAMFPLFEKDPDAAPVIAPGEAVRELAALRAGLFQYRLGLPADDLACLDHDLKLHGATLSPPPSTGSDGRDAKDVVHVLIQQWRDGADIPERGGYENALTTCADELDAAMAQLTARARDCAEAGSAYIPVATSTGEGECTPAAAPAPAATGKPST